MYLFTEIILGRLSEEKAISKYCCIVCILLACVSNNISVVLGKREAEEQEETNTE